MELAYDICMLTKDVQNYILKTAHIIFIFIINRRLSRMKLAILLLQ